MTFIFETDRKFCGCPTFELYNLKEDPLEQNNLAAVHPQRAKTMETDLHRWFEDVCNDLAKTRRD